VVSAVFFHFSHVSFLSIVHCICSPDTCAELSLLPYFFKDFFQKTICVLNSLNSLNSFKSTLTAKKIEKKFEKIEMKVIIYCLPAKKFGGLGPLFWEETNRL
jgi:hypothetical protein